MAEIYNGYEGRVERDAPLTPEQLLPTPLDAWTVQPGRFWKLYPPRVAIRDHLAGVRRSLSLTGQLSHDPVGNPSIAISGLECETRPMCLAA